MQYTDVENKKQIAANWFESLRDSICSQFEKLEREADSSAKFIKNKWNREGGGGGEISVMHGKIFEKVGVNISTVSGEFNPEFAKEIPGTENNKSFWASGISLVAHMYSPLIPAVHMNTRFIVTEKSWFGGGSDLTPTFANEEDAELFHNSLKSMCDKFNLEYYPKFKKTCDEYFFLPHRNETRGIGGIFYDYLNTNNWHNDFTFTQSVGETLGITFTEIVKRNMYKNWTAEQKEQQLIKRGRYVEFNLLYDRGTKFGLMTNGSTEAILMSLPPLAKWV